MQVATKLVLQTSGHGLCTTGAPRTVAEGVRFADATIAEYLIMQSRHAATPRHAAPRTDEPTGDREHEPSSSTGEDEPVESTRPSRRIDCTPSTALGGMPERMADDARDGRKHASHR